ncbi:hypothetical protein GE21DRAFT_1089786 [Neurospora crassa]|nr:hypothetical protein GE21DRAFT_1089786 [Neurospora crassa]
MGWVTPARTSRPAGTVKQWREVGENVKTARHSNILVHTTLNLHHDKEARSGARCGDKGGGRGTCEPLRMDAEIQFFNEPSLTISFTQILTSRLDRQVFYFGQTICERLSRPCKPERKILFWSTNMRLQRQVYCFHVQQHLAGRHQIITTITWKTDIIYSIDVCRCHHLPCRTHTLTCTLSPDITTPDDAQHAAITR